MILLSKMYHTHSATIKNLENEEIEGENVNKL